MKIILASQSKVRKKILDKFNDNDFVKNNNISIGKLHQKSYAQLMAEKKPTVTKTLPFNYASMHIMRKKARRTCGNQKYESVPAKINLAKHA